MKILTREVNPEYLATLKQEGLSDLLARIYAARGIKTTSEIRQTIKDIEGLEKMKGLQKAAERIADAIEMAHHVVISGDFDADGAASSSLLIEAIEKMGGKTPVLFIPDRIKQGYGLSPSLVADMPEGIDLIITVDNGISSHAGVEAANQRGMTVIITDHHLPGDTLPNAYAIVNPNQPGCDFPWKGTAGVGVAFYVAGAVRAELERRNWFEQQGIPKMSLMPLLDLVAVATIGDVAPFEKNNRILIAEGIGRIRSGTCRPGIKALIEVARRNAEHITATDIAFMLAPRINAAGRLADMKKSVRLMLAKTEAEAMPIAQELDAMNRSRQDIQAEIQEEADNILKEQQQSLGDVGYSIVVSNPQWHEGIIGIVAGKIREAYHRPTIVLTKAENGEYKGSGRSIPGLNLRDAIAATDTRTPGIITRFGGHAAAAGLMLVGTEEAIKTFAVAFEKTVKAMLAEADLVENVVTDGPLDDRDFTMENIRAIEDGGPWGRGFEPPLFTGRLHLYEVQEVAKGGLKFQTRIGKKLVKGIWFRKGKFAEQPIPEPGQSIACTFTPTINRFRGNENLEIMVTQVFD
ncbi:single-stranded-DNA-specific exonuclease RecJ [Acidithiobacillus marinus]|uniref:Single-stranded-DNA-specific exonuclease RecJ n=1 Tax=Acidithiobacillus marinus TaxID=187490 RepID=A0A2I1DIG5_9PROT|nr:single-stranded-DNA-specific exonuclease RecJ [Acidithiobacillus marinus]PKY09667.1 single-stranded-DNA-specific exonuclease RecJ [Acidithiobacillus marinus]